jgi:Protein of unknown function (DUF732)
MINHNRATKALGAALLGGGLVLSALIAGIPTATADSAAEQQYLNDLRNRTGVEDAASAVHEGYAICDAFDQGYTEHQVEGAVFQAESTSQIALSQYQVGALVATAVIDLCPRNIPKMPAAFKEGLRQLGIG